MNATPSSQSSSPSRRPGRHTVILAFVGLTVGLWLLLDQAGVSTPSPSRWWPIFLLLGAVASFLDYRFLSRSPLSAAQTVIGLGLAVLTFPFTLGYREFSNVLDWLPGLPTVAALAFLTAWVAGGRKSSAALVAGIVLLGLGIAGFIARFEELRRILPSAQLIWAGLLIVGSGLLLWRTFGRR
jgi:hypothetical protein